MRLSALSCSLLTQLFLLTSVGISSANSLQFYLEYSYSQSESETTRADGTRSNFDSTNKIQRYRLDINRDLYPNLSLRGGGNFERNDSDGEMDDVSFSSRFTRISPYLDLMLNAEPFWASVGLQRQEEKISSGSSDLKHIRDSFRSSFYWKPVDLPTLDLKFSQEQSYDSDRELEDTTNRRYLVASEYQLAKPLNISYSGTMEEYDNHIDKIQTEIWLHSGRLEYLDSFWQDRTTINGTYDISYRSIETVASVGGEVEIPPLQLPINTSFTLDDSPEDTSPASPSENWGSRNLIDVPGARLRNISLEFLVPPRINVLKFTVTSPALNNPNEIALANEPALINAMQLQVYVSNNGEDWLLRPPVTAAFETFTHNIINIRFPEISTANYIKLVVRPLPSGSPLATIFPNFEAVGLSASLISQAADVVGKDSLTSHIVNFNTRTRLLDSPMLSHSLSLYYTMLEPAGDSRTYITNSLNLYHTLLPWLTVNALVARDDKDEPQGNQVTHRWSGLLSATPLPALRHTLNYSGKSEDLPDGTATTNSFYNTNQITIYRGVDLYLNGGANFQELQTGEEVDTYIFNSGINVVPHSTMNLDFGYSFTRSKSSRGSESEDKTTRAAISWTPLDSLNLYASLEMIERLGEDRKTQQAYSLNWSPFRDGTLQFNLYYTELLYTDYDTEERSFGPSLTWTIRPGTILTVYYSQINLTSDLEETETRTSNIMLQANF